MTRAHDIVDHRSDVEIRVDMQCAMQRRCAVFRDGPLSAQGQSRLAAIGRALHDQLGRRDRVPAFSDLLAALALDTMHARADDPGRDHESWPKHRPAVRDAAGTRPDHRPVHLDTLSNEVASLPPNERVY